MTEPTEFIKDDSTKVRYDLIDPWALHALAQVYTYGANKYADDNMLIGCNWSRYFAALLRHVWAWWRGEDNDPESGLPHLAHAAWSCFTLMRYAWGGLGTDNRPRLKPTAPPACRIMSEDEYKDLLNNLEHQQEV